MGQSDKKNRHRGEIGLWAKMMRSIGGSRFFFLAERFGDLVTGVGGAVIPAARALREKKMEKKGKKTTTVVIFTVCA